MSQEDKDLLDRHGWDVICEHPLELEHRDTKSFADGVMAKMTLQLIKDGIVT